MERIYYNDLLNHKVIGSMNKRANIVTIVLLAMMFLMAIFNPISDGLFSFQIICIIIAIPILGLMAYKRNKETKEIKELTNFYNNCTNYNAYTQVDDDLKSGFLNMSKNVISNKLELIWEPNFIYDDETKVYKVENTQVIIVNGHFKDESVSRGAKRQYIIVFVNCEYYMSCIDNLICWEKGTQWSKFYTEKALKNINIDFTQW